MHRLQNSLGPASFVGLLCCLWLCCELCDSVGLRGLLSAWTPEWKARNLTLVQSFCAAVGRRGQRFRRLRTRKPDSDLVAAVAYSLQQGFDACRDQFQGERWSCDLRQRRSRRRIFKKVYRETAVLYALTAASLAHTVARACSSGHLSRRCSCDDASQGPADNRDAWRWGGCGDNYPFASKFTRRFLTATATSRRDAGHGRQLGPRVIIDRHNIAVGVRVLRRGLRRVCRCHGMSGSCSVTTCWELLSNYGEAAATIKAKYPKAVQAKIFGNQPSRRSSIAALKARDKLLFLHESPSFCESNPLSPGTRARRCDTDHCDDLCCGRGYDIFTETVDEPCRCRVIWCCRVECEMCRVNRLVNICK